MENRIDPVSLSPTIPRQTPANEFGRQLLAVVGRGAQLGAVVLGAAGPGAPVASAAVAATRGLVSALAPVSGSAPGSAPGRAEAVGQFGERQAVEGLGDGALDALSRQEVLNHESQAFSAMYLRLQDEMQQESRQYTALSNVLKVRHDSAKAAINNVR